MDNEKTEKEEVSEVTNATEESNYKPNRLQQVAMVGMMVLVLISFSVANLQSILWINSDWLVSTILPAVVTEATNKARAEEGQSPLTRNTLLDEAARLKAEDMANNGYFSHWSPTGVSPWHWFAEAGYSYAHAGENLAVHFTDSSAVVDAWLKSPTHRDNIMSAKYTEIGIGTAEGKYEGYDTVFVVQMFGTPAAAKASSAVTAPAALVSPEVVDDVADMTEESVTQADQGEETVSVTEAGTVVLETFAATEAPGEVLAESDTRGASFFGRVATSPRLFLQISYSIIGTIVLLLLLTSLILEWRKRHPVQMVYSAGLMVTMLVLFMVHSWASGGVLII